MIRKAPRTFLLLALAAAAIGVALAQDGQSESTRFERMLEGMLSTPERQVSLRGLSGAFTSSPSVETITVSDAEGVWLELEGVEAVWSRTALLRRVLDIDSLTARQITVLRKPAPGAEPVESGGGTAGAPPVDIIVDAFRLPSISLAEPVIGEDAQLSAEGDLRYTADELAARLAVLRHDREGRLSADLRLVPADNALTANVQLAEPEGGIVAEWLALRGAPALTLSLAGSGPLARWQAEIDMQANDARVLAGLVAVTRIDAGYRIAGELSAALESIAPPEYAPLLAGEGRLSLNVVRGDDGGLTIENAALRSEGIDLSARAMLTPDLVPASAELSLQLGAAGRTTLPFVPGEVSVMNLTATIGLDDGAIAPWRADISAEGVESAFGNVESIAMTASGEGERLTDPAERSVTFNLDANASGIAPQNAAVAEALGPTLQLTGSGAWTAGGPVSFESLQAALTGATASFAGTADVAELNGRFNIDVADLSRFAAIAARPLGGSAQLQAEGIVTPSDAGFDLQLGGGATDLSLGIEALDPLLAGTSRLEGGIARDADGLTFDDLALSNEAASARVSGSLAGPEIDVTATANVADLSTLSDRAEGGAAIEATISGTTAAPEIDAEITGENIVLMGRPLDDAMARFTGTVAGPDVNGEADISGSLGGVPVAGAATLSSAEGGGRALDDLMFSVGESRASGNLVIGGDGLLRGNLNVASPDLSQVAPLFLAEARGMVRADVTLSADGGRQSARLSGSAADVAYEAVTVGSATIAGTAQDLFGVPRIDGTFDVRSLTAGGLTIVTANGTAQRQGAATGFSVNAELADGRAAIAGSLEPRGQGLALALRNTSFARAGASLALAAPATIFVENGTARFDDVRLNLGGGGGVTLRGTAGSSLNLSVDASGVPASLANAFAPDLGAEGTISGNATVTGAASAPNGRFNVTWSGASLAATRNAGLGALAVSADGALANGSVRLNGRATGTDGLSIQATGTAGIAAGGPLNLRITGAVPLSLGNRSLASRGAALQGALQVDIAVTGTTSAPQFSGRVTSEGGGLVDPESGIVLSGLSLAASVSNNRIVVDRLNARSGSGTVSASGSIGLDPGAGFPVDLTIDAQRVRYVDGTLVAAELDADITVTGGLTAGPVIGGTVLIHNAEITVPESLPRDSVAVDVEHIHTPPDVQATLDRVRETGGGSAAGGSGGGVTLNVTVDAPSRIFVRGRGLDTEMGGRLRLTGLASSLVADGAFEMRRGRLDIFTQRITFDRGIVTFAGDLDPVLDFVGTTQSRDVSITVTVSGNASDPEVLFSSVPELPQDEVLAHLIFNQSIGNLSPVQIARLADAAAQLSGGGGGLLNSLRASTGLDDLDIVTDEEGRAAVAAGRYINENIYLGVQQGTDTRVTIDLDVTNDVKVRGAVSPQGDSSLGIFFEREY